MYPRDVSKDAELTNEGDALARGNSQSKRLKKTLIKGMEVR